LALGAVVMACGTPQLGGPRREASEDDDAGTSGTPMSCGEITCVEPGSCVERVERGVTVAACTCPKGYRLNGNRCQDIDECARPADNDCDANAVCENLVGSFSCRCKPGFGLEGKTCKSLDSCVGVANTCHPLASCALDAVGGIACKCGEGFEGDGRSCTDVDECKDGSAMCAGNAHCVNARDGYSCACDTLFTGDGKVQCRDRCDAAQADSDVCDPGGHGQCVIGPNGEATCPTCRSDSLGNGRRCTPNNACAALGCGPNTICTGSACECAPGFNGDPTAGCQDINECTMGAQLCDPATSRCLNTAGSYMCECMTGFERDGDECIDVNECARKTDRCDQNATCVNETPGYICQCKAGFELQANGLSCADVDECTTGAAECRADDKSVMCVNTRGGYKCQCPKGYAGDGESEACYCDLSGWWAVRQDATLSFPERVAAGQVLVAKSVTYASVWELHKYTYDGNKIVVQKKACGSDVAPEIYSPLYDETFSSWTPTDVFDHMPLMASVDIPLSKSMAQPGTSFTTPKAAVVYGIKLNDPVNDPFPAKFSDVPADQWVDTEDDGELGITLWPIGTTQPARSGRNGETLSYLPVALEEGTSIIDRRLGCASVALRTTGSNRINIDSCDVLSGNTLETSAEGRVHSCTVLRMEDWEKTDVTCTSQNWRDARRCTKEEVQFLDEQDQKNTVTATFEIQKLGGLDGPDQECPAVRAKLPARPRDM
jgi:hypothetical protein